MSFKRLGNLAPHLASLVAILMLCTFYFYPQLQGKKIIQGDIMIFEGMSKELKDHKEASGEYALWTNAMFGGMPAYQIHLPQKMNIFKSLENLLQLGFSRPIGYFIYGAICFYLMMIMLGVSPWLSLIAAIAFSFTTNNLVLYEAGHTSKVRAIMSSPLIIAGLIYVIRKNYWLGGLIFCLGMGLNLYANHYQMTYYLGIVVLVFIVIELVNFIRTSDYSHIWKSGLILLFGLLIAIGSASSRLLPTMEYSEDTMRGSPILDSEGVVTTSSQTEGLEWNYAMNWSNGLIDIWATLIPGVAGGSGSEPVSDDSAFAEFLERRGAQYSGQLTAPLYWGPLPFTSGPIYLGCVFMFLSLFGVLFKKGALKWWFLIAVVLTYLLSMGKYFPELNRFVFDHIPLYNKFRTPQSILSVTAILIPLFGALALHDLILERKKDLALKALYISSAIMLTFCLFFALAGPSFYDFSSPSDARLAMQGFDLDVIKEDRKALMRSDAWRTFGLIFLTAVLIWFYIRGKLKMGLLLTGLGLLTLFDVFGIGRRYLNHRTFVREGVIEQRFEPRQADLQILKDTDPHFRVHDTTINPFENSSSSYFHKTIGGNHAAKLQRYQDMIDYHISKNNMWVLNMLNTRYFIVEGENNQPVARLNYSALGNAWFINRIHLVETANEEINALTEFDPAGEVFVHREFEEYVSGIEPGKNGSIRLVEYEPDYLKYNYSTEGEQFVVFSEVWYGPDKGWQAYIDGMPANHIRVNYILRGMRVPGGSHTIEFRFNPQSYMTGKRIAYISTLLFGLFGLWTLIMNRGNIVHFFKEPAKEETPVRKRVKTVVKRRKTKPR